MPSTQAPLPPPPPPPPQWVIDLSDPPSTPAKSSNVPDPPGFPTADGSSGKVSRAIVLRTIWRLTRRQRSGPTKNAGRMPPSTEETDTLKLKKSWELALAPAKQLPMNAIMMYMSGNSLQIFSIMMVFMLFTNPIKGLVGTNQVFARFETEGTKSRLYSVKAVYVLMQIVALGLGLWKVNAMGLLP